MLVSGKKEFKKVPQGLHLAVCTEIVDLGTQKSEYKGKAREARKVVVRFTLSHTLHEEGELAGTPMHVSQTFTASLSEKATLRKFLESWRGQAFSAAELEGFNLGNLLGKPCQLQIIHETKGDKAFANISSVVGVMKGTAIPAVDSLRLFDLDAFEQEVFDALPDWQKEQIVESPEYKRATGNAEGTPAGDGVNW
jgi:hypothetical protein